VLSISRYYVEEKKKEKKKPEEFREYRQKSKTSVSKSKQLLESRAEVVP